jgi:hypothetical protein
MRTRGLWQMLGALAAPCAVLCAVAAGCEPQDIYLFDETAEGSEPDAGDDEPEPEPEPDAAPPAFEPPMCASNACDECVERGCSVQSATLFCHPVTGICRLPCDPETPAGDRPCPGDQHCDTSIGLCVDCVGPDDCSGGSLQACDVERGVCVECVGPATCTAPGRGVCDPTTYQCVGCLDDPDCDGQVCLRSEQRCVQCLDDGDCSGFEDDNLCVPGAYVCGECVDNAQCAAIDPTRGICSDEYECEDE